MTLAPGSKLGPYEIVGLLGAGGMGEVYRAKDERLKREVAIKVLPASFSQDADRLRRFEQEAQAAGVLNHPNITAVYDLGSHDGAPYIVTELLEGETLRSRLSAGSLPARKAIDYAVQIARGLAAAHEKGIVHRDLKPENLFLTRDGRVKILDFGLAKLKTEKEGEAQTEMKTISGTEPGVVLGTMGYMSPEQVRGKAADRRSDLFSFGAILYEMLSGQRAFRGDTAADTITAILTKEPPDISQTNKDVHPGLDRVVRHCLEKNPEERFESARDVAFDLESLSNVSGIGIPKTGDVGPAPSSAHGGLRWSLAALAVLLALALGAAGGLFAAKHMSENRTVSFRQLTFRRGQVLSARFAPDGETILYTAAWDGRPMELFTTRLDSPESRPFGLVGAELLSIASTGEMAVSLGRRSQGGFTRVGMLARLGMTGGGAPKDVREDVLYADWSPDGKDLAVVRDAGGKSQLEYPIGNVLYASAGWLSHPRVSPSGDEIAVIEHPTTDDDGGYVLLLDKSGHKKKISGDFASILGLCWERAGREVWFTASRIGFNRFVHAAKRSGAVRVLAVATGGMTIEDVSRSGRVLLSQDKARQGIVAFAPGMEKERDLSWLDWSLVAGISSDGNTILFDESGEGGGAGYSVYARKLDGSPAVRLGEGSAQALSPDGKLALAIVHPSSDPKVVIYPIGPGDPRFLETPGLTVQAAAWLPDGNRLLLSANESGRGIRTYIYELGSKKSRALTPEGYRLFSSGVSPDGRFFAVSGPDRKPYLYPLEGGEPTPLAIEGSWFPTGWSADGGSLFLRRRGEIPESVRRLDLKTGSVSPFLVLMPGDSAGVTSVGSTRITPDGRAYAFSYLRSLADLYVVEGLK